MKYLFFIFFSLISSFQIHSISTLSSKKICSDYQRITSYDSLIWPDPNTPLPWDIFPFIKIYSSQCINENFDAFFSKIIPFSNNITFSTFLQTLLQNGCVYYPHGGFVRDLVNSVYPHDLDGQYSCKTEEILKYCREILGESFCSADRNSSFFFIGNHSLEGFNWNAFFSLEDQEYTPDSLYYDPLNKVLIDLSGNGLEDIMRTQIRIPVERSNWDKWLIKDNDDPILRLYSLRKVPRYWKLKKIGFKDYNEETLRYLKNKIASLWDNNRYPMKNAFKLHFCWILDGKYSDNTTKYCQPKDEMFDVERVIKFKEFIEIIMVEFDQMPKKVLKDLKKLIKETGCFLMKSFETIWIILLALILINVLFCL